MIKTIIAAIGIAMMLSLVAINVFAEKQDPQDLMNNIVSDMQDLVEKQRTDMINSYVENIKSELAQK